MAALLALALPPAASATGVVESLRGTAMAGQGALAQGERFVAPASIRTGAGSQAVLKFDDGMQMVLDENTVVRILQFRHAGKGGEDRAVFELLFGAARVVTGRIAADSPGQFFFQMPQTRLMVERPADFSVVLVNPAYIAVHAGSLISSNAWGTTTLGTGSTTVVAASAAAPAAIAPSAMPQTAAASMKTLQTASVGVPAGASAAGAAAAAAADVPMPPILATVVTLGIIAAVLAGLDGNGTATTQH
ncbi:MAG TPA: FecR domain-containing protein [Burkholderiales bacterium]|nr:FecR domain-containing protein [Burkholderiales bacterium]